MSEKTYEPHQKVDPPRLATCPHCGNRTPHTIKHREDYYIPEHLDEDDVYLDPKWFAILKCGDLPEALAVCRLLERS